MTTEEFIKRIAKYVKKYAPKYGILCNSAVIGQAILESGWGESRLSAEYNNHFGLKCGTNWKGKSVSLQTQEEYQPGVMTNISDNFRVYDSFKEGVKGYFEFIQLPRYQNLKGITSPWEYLTAIILDGYATDSNYVNKVMQIVNQCNLREYDDGSVLNEEEKKKDEPKESSITAKDVISEAAKWLGTSYEGHNQIVDIYNSHEPLAVGYRVQYYDDWCDTFVSAMFISLNATELIGGTECGVERHVQLFKKIGIWEEDGSIVPSPGDIIVYNWGLDMQPNDGWADHIGIVVDVKDGVIKTIEGNVDNAVKHCYVTVGNGNIRGFARPKYGTESVQPLSDVNLDLIAQEVILGKWGNGEARKNALTKAGWDYYLVQSKVNEVLKG